MHRIGLRKKLSLFLKMAIHIRGMLESQPQYLLKLNLIAQFWRWVKQKLREISHKLDSLGGTVICCF